MLLDSSTHKCRKETLYLQKAEQRFVKATTRLYGLLDSKIKQRYFVLNSKGTKWTTVVALSNTVSASIHMQCSQDCKD